MGTPEGLISYGDYPFGLSDEDEQRAERLHTESVVIDLCFQGPCSPDTWTPELVAALDQKLAETGPEWDTAYRFLLERALSGDYPEYRELYTTSGASAGISEAIVISREQLLIDASLAARMLTGLEGARRPFSADDFRETKRAGGISIWGMCQFNWIRPWELDLVDLAHSLGIMDTVELAYNQGTFIGTGCTEAVDPGLTRFGVRFVQRCNDVGVIVDTAHSGTKTTLDACRASRYPVAATHTSAAAVYQHDRAKSDEELRAIADTGGVIGVYCVPAFLSPPGETSTIERVLDHLDYIAELVGPQHVGFGTDWPLALPHLVQQRLLEPLFEEIGFSASHALDVTAALRGFRDYRDLRNITRGLVARGYADDDIKAIVGENFLRVFDAVRSR
jgi:membrane dipeptidase